MSGKISTGGRPRPAASRKAAAPRKAEAPAAPKKKSRPILEVALILVLIKIALGAAYIMNRTPEAGRASLETARLNRAAEPAPPAQPPPAQAEPDYLAAALRAAQPAQAEAAPPRAALAAGALSAGALLVVGGQSGAARAGDIPLPPGGEELLKPAAKLPGAGPIPPRPGPAASAGGRSEAGADFEALRALREREQELARREALLTSRESSLGTLETELNQRLRTSEASQREIEAMLQRNEAVLAEQKAWVEQQKKEDDAQRDARLTHLVAAYSGMKPEQAGNLINSMDDDVAVAILSAMPGGKTGKILAMVNPEKAARLTKAISEKRLDPNTLLDETQAAAAQ